MALNTKRFFAKVYGETLASGLARLSLCFLTLAVTLGAQQQSSCGITPTGKNFSGQALTRQNFSHLDLTGANFEGATLSAAAFLGTNLTNANFQNATITSDSSNPVLVTDFSMANLTGTCFQGAKFTGTTYFTYSTLTCTDFSQTDVSSNTIFGPSPQFNSSGCRPSFRSATMSCEFVNAWQYVDLSNAIITPCFPQMTKGNFTNAQMAGVNFTGADLDGAQFGNAVLTQATFTGASLQGADLSYAKLQGATLDSANLTSANLYHALLSNDTQGDVNSAASAKQAHLKNVNLSFATLSGVNFTFANFYGTLPAGQNSCGTEQDNYQGFTKNCAAAHGATLNGTNFTNAFLFGVDFSEAEMHGVNLTQAVLVGANLSATLGTNTFNGNATTLFRSFLQGVNLGSATLTDPVDATAAFLDFLTGGNDVYVYLEGANHNQFACKGCTPPTGTDVCIDTYYNQPSTVPVPGTENSRNLTPCPVSSAAQPKTGPCSGADWKSSLLNCTLSPGQCALPSGVPSFWYASPPTYSLPAWWPQPQCKGLTPISPSTTSPPTPTSTPW